MPFHEHFKVSLSAGWVWAGSAEDMLGLRPDHPASLLPGRVRRLLREQMCSLPGRYLLSIWALLVGLQIHLLSVYLSSTGTPAGQTYLLSVYLCSTARPAGQTHIFYQFICVQLVGLLHRHILYQCVCVCYSPPQFSALMLIICIGFVILGTWMASYKPYVITNFLLQKQYIWLVFKDKGGLFSV